MTNTTIKAKFNDEEPLYTGKAEYWGLPEGTKLKIVAMRGYDFNTQFFSHDYTYVIKDNNLWKEDSSLFANNVDSTFKVISTPVAINEKGMKDRKISDVPILTTTLTTSLDSLNMSLRYESGTYYIYCEALGEDELEVKDSNELQELVEAVKVINKYGQ